MNWFRIVREGSVCSALVDHFLLSDFIESHFIEIVLEVSTLSAPDAAPMLPTSHVPMLFSNFRNSIKATLINF